MKISKSVICILLSITLLSCTKPMIEADYAVIPLPQEISQTQGEQFDLNRKTTITYEKGNEEQKKIAELLAEYLKQSANIRPNISDEVLTENAIVLKTDYISDRAEAYKLSVTKLQITINGSDNAGLFHGVQTLRKSIPAKASEHTVLFPLVEINDYPRFQYRGLMLDVSRHFFSVETIKKELDLMALHNINRFHWHLTDDQGWRIEIKKYPKLTQIGSQRAQTTIGKNTGKYDGQPYGGFYTQEQIKEVVAYAKERYITIIPEIDLPGHMSAALAAYPNLGCTGGPYKVIEEWGVFEDVLCAGNEEIYTFIDDVFTEVIALFPSEYIHVGGDECPKTRWQACPKCQAKIKELNLHAQDGHTAEEKLQSYVIARAEKFLNSKGRQIIGWDEILEGGVAPNATIMSWRGTKGGIAAAKQHHNVVMAPATHLYFDYYQTKEIEGEAFGIGGYNPIDRIYNFEPMVEELNAKQKKYIIGTQGNLWAEYVLDAKHQEYLLYPRVAALAEIQWTMPEKKDYSNFLFRLDHLTNCYNLMDVNYSTHFRDIEAEITNDTRNKVMTIKLSTFDNATIYYTLDGTEPTKDSPLYTEAINIKKSADLKAIALRIDEKKNSKIFLRTIDINKATFKKVSLSPNQENASILVDGLRGKMNPGYNEGWLRFDNAHFEATVDLEDETDVSSTTLGNHIDVRIGFYGPTEIKVFVSADKRKFREVASQTYPPYVQFHPIELKDFTVSFHHEKARYVKIVAKSIDALPEWALAKGKKGALRIDEIKIK